MPEVISEPSRIPVPGGKVIEEFIGRVATGTAAVSVARMQAPAGWDEPAQTPDFDEVTLMVRGSLIVTHDGGVLEVGPGQALLTRAGERVRYAAGPEGADYVAVCVPAFAPDLAHRDVEPGPEGGGSAGRTGDGLPGAAGEAAGEGAGVDGAPRGNSPG